MPFTVVAFTTHVQGFRFLFFSTSLYARAVPNGNKRNELGYIVHVKLHFIHQHELYFLHFPTFSQRGLAWGQIPRCWSCREVDNCAYSSVKVDRRRLTRRRTTSIQYPSGSKMNARKFIFPSLRRFLNVTPSLSKRAHAASTSGTVMAMWPKPFGSSLPERYGVVSRVSVPWL